MEALQDIVIGDFDKNQKLITLPDRYLLVNYVTADLIRILQQSSSLEDAHRTFCAIRDVSLSFDDFQRLIKEKLAPYGIVQMENVPLKKKNREYLKLKVQILSAEYVGRLGDRFAFLFTSTVFWFLFVVAVIVNLANVLLSTFEQLQIHDILLSVILFGLSTAFHEIGHIAACRCFGAKHGGMGFGFYLLWPVAYSDVTGIWTLKKSERVIANLAGIYMELLYASFLVFGMLISDLSQLGIAAILISIRTSLQLNPFLRKDGYWLVCDLFSQPNLMPRASLAIKDYAISLCSTIIGKNSRMAGQKVSGFVLFYGIVNLSIGFIFIFVIYAGYTESILLFPQRTIENISKMLHGVFDSQAFGFQYWVAFAFYFLLILRLKSALSVVIRYTNSYFSQMPERKVRDK